MLLDGIVVGHMDRNGPANLTFTLPSVPQAPQAPNTAELSIVVEAIGRANEGWRFDVKGLKSPEVTLNGASLPL